MNPDLKGFDISGFSISISILDDEKVKKTLMKVSGFGFTMVHFL